MTRVATFGNYQSALLDLMKAQARAAEAQERVATQKNATDLTGFGRQSETLTALKGAQSRIQGFMDTGEAVLARLTTQDLALTRVGDGIGGIREALGNALAADASGSLMQQLEGYFQEIRGGLNMRHQGSYIFAGARVDTAPVEVASMAGLPPPGDVATMFANDTIRTASRVAEGTTLETGHLADEVGSGIMRILSEIQAFHTGPQGPLTGGKLTADQRAFLSAKLEELPKVAQRVTELTAQTGAKANQVEDIAKGLEAQSMSLGELVSNRTDADMARAITDLQLSQVAIEASAQVISQLRQVSLLNYLR
jgi:flagellar hook-associated protein 3 FlgL